MAAGGAQAQAAAAVAEQMAGATLHLQPPPHHGGVLPCPGRLPPSYSSLGLGFDSFGFGSPQKQAESASQIKTVVQLLSNMENNQLRSILPASRLEKAEKNTGNELRVE
uniref:Uncharacterized protein n=1 Tax=Oryza brachyantha TaxID=4533 RepID=J3L9X4_ORYBR